jgi:hypothetical protein
MIKTTFIALALAACATDPVDVTTSVGQEADVATTTACSCWFEPLSGSSLGWCTLRTSDGNLVCYVSNPVTMTECQSDCATLFDVAHSNGSCLADDGSRGAALATGSAAILLP